MNTYQQFPSSDEQAVFAEHSLPSVSEKQPVKGLNDIII